MSKEEMKRKGIMDQLVEKQIRQKTAAEVLGISMRQLKRLLKAFREEGAKGLISKQRGQQALVALPEKALLDLVYLQPGGDKPDYLRELRLQNLEWLDMDELYRQAEIFNTPKLYRAAEAIVHLSQYEAQDYEPL
jgi:hypothetical protein